MFGAKINYVFELTRYLINLRGSVLNNYPKFHVDQSDQWCK